jgi:hypothetical protein
MNPSPSKTPQISKFAPTTTKTSNSCCEQNQPDGHQQAVYIEMVGKADSTKINQQEYQDEETSGLPTSQHKVHTTERQQTH